MEDTTKPKVEVLLQHALKESEFDDSIEILRKRYPYQGTENVRNTAIEVHEAKTSNGLEGGISPDAD